MRGHVAIITETESTLRFDDVEVIPGFLPLLWAVQRSRMWSRERSGRWPGNEATLYNMTGYGKREQGTFFSELWPLYLSANQPWRECFAIKLHVSILTCKTSRMTLSTCQCNGQSLNFLSPGPFTYYVPLSLLVSAAADTSTSQLPLAGLQERMSPLTASHTQRRRVRGSRARAGVRERLERLIMACLFPTWLLGVVRIVLEKGSRRLSW